MIRASDRLQNTKEYYFSKKLKEVKRLILEGKPIINLGIGSPDIKPPKKVVQTMIRATDDDKAHQYQPYAGITELREAIQHFYNTNYGVDLSSDDNILPLMGSKEGILHISMAFVNPGDEILIPNPGYPTYAAVSELVQAKTVYYELSEDNNWQPNLKQIEKRISPKTKLMWINYPNMPTGTSADFETLNALVEFTKKHNILLVNDNPYSLILNDKPQSILQNKWPNEHVLELNSLSKTFNLSGWRVGMLCGHEKLIQHVIKVKSNMDSGMFYPIQKGGIEALKSTSDWFQHLNTIYRTRRELIWQICDNLRLSYNKDTCGLFVWAKITQEKTAEEFSDLLLNEFNMFVTPGTVFGSQGEGYLRFSLCVDAKDIHTCIERTKRFKL